MKKFTIFILAALLNVCAAMAVPAYKGIVVLQQPDGSVINARAHGDEWLNLTTTDDGYSIVKDADGFYVYAQLKNGQLAPTAVRVHNADARTAQEQAYLGSVQKYLWPQMSEATVKAKSEENARRVKAQGRRKAQNYDYNNFRGLIILVQFNNREFERDDYSEIIGEMVNGKDYTGYMGTNGRKVNYTGSVRDYFYDNSFTQFEPQFDIVGPVTVDRSDTYAERTDNAAQLTLDAIDAIDDQVDFSEYDRDGDGVVDMIYFIFAGYGSNFYGQSSDYVWPHASQIYDPRTYRYVIRDNVYLGRYACSTEFYGTERSHTIDGIGTICHEFSHVLGLMDHYDTDYEQNGQSNDPGEWDVMAGGSYHNMARTPVGYSIFERFSIGFAVPETIDGEGSFTLEDIDKSNTGYIIKSQQNREYFMFENRRKDKWNAYLPNTGMLVFRVDSTSTNVWSRNTVNANPNHNYYQMVRAGGARGYAAASDPFPGTNGVTELNNATTPANLLSWAGKETKWGLTNIRETDGVITFDVEDTYKLKGITIEESVTVGVGVTRQINVEGDPSYIEFEVNWDCSDTNIATVDNDGRVTGVAPGSCSVTATTTDGQFSATCQVNVEEQLIVNSIAEFKVLADGTKCQLKLNDARVLYVYQKDIYLRDATGAIVFDNTGLQASRYNTVNGTIFLVKGSRNNMPVATADAEKTDLSAVTVTSGSTIQPREVTFDELTENDYADYVLVKTVELQKDGGLWAVSGNKRARLYSTLGVRNLTIPTDLTDKRYNITCIFGTNVLNGEVIDELYLLKSPEVDNGWSPEPQYVTVDDIAELKELEDGTIARLILTNAQVLMMDEDGDGVIRDGSGALSTYLPSVTLNVNDVINGELIVKYYVEDGMAEIDEVKGVTTYDNFNVSEGNPAEPIVVTIDQLAALDTNEKLLASPLTSNLVQIQECALEPAYNFLGMRFYTATQASSVGSILVGDGMDGVIMPVNPANKLYNLTGFFGHLVEEDVNMDIYAVILSESPTLLDGIDEMKTDDTSAAPGYNLAGQRVADSFKGIVVHGGHKAIVK